MAAPQMLPTTPLPHIAMDYARLRAEGLTWLGRLSGTQWTDYNAHDPGITILEQLCYAITDLGYRTAYPIADLLAGVQDPALPDAATILSGNPVTDADLRKLALDAAGGASVWLQHQTAPEVTFYYHAARGELRFRPDPGAVAADPVALVGLQQVLLANDALTQQVAQRLHAARALGQDFEVATLKSFGVWLKIGLEIGQTDDPVGVAAQVLGAIHEYLTPTPRFVPAANLLAENQPDRVFDGPRLDHGVLEELLDPPRQITTSDLIHLIRDVPSVRAVRLLLLGSSQTTEQRWALEVPAGHVPELASNSELTLWRDGVEVPFDLSAAWQRAAGERMRPAAGADTAPEVRPAARRDRALGSYRTLPEQLPELYGVGTFGLPETAPARRKAQALQLQAYLSLFDKVLASSFSLLANAGSLMSARPTPSSNTAGVNGQRRKILTHLLARFGEELRSEGQSGVPDSEALLSDYPRLSGGRGTGLNLWADRQSQAEQATFVERLRCKLGLTVSPEIEVVEHVLLRPVQEDDAQREAPGEEEVPLLRGVASADPWSLQVSIVVHGTASDVLRQLALAELPAHLKGRLVWLTDEVEGAQDWSEFQKSWRRFKTCYERYRFDTGNVDDVHRQLEARDARDDLLELLEVGQPMPLRDLPLAPVISVTPGGQAKIPLEFSQASAVYRLFRLEDGKPVAVVVAGVPVEVPGTGGAIELPTAPIQVDGHYRVQAVKRVGAGAPSERAVWLKTTVEVQEVVDPSLVVQLRDVPLLDPRIDEARPGDARLTDFGTQPEVEVLESQEGVEYQLIAYVGDQPVPVDPAEYQVISTAMVKGDNGTIVLRCMPLSEDIDLQVWGKKTVGNPARVVMSLLHQRLRLRVRANRALSVACAAEVIDFGSRAQLTVAKTQASVDYSVFARTIHDAEFVFRDLEVPAAGTVDVDADGRLVRIARPERAHPWRDLPGFSRVGSLQPGGAALTFDLGSYQFDSMFLVRGDKRHLLGGRDNEDPVVQEHIASSVQLSAAAVCLVRPNAAQALTITAQFVAGQSAGPLALSGGQAGVYYSLAKAGQAVPLGRPGYFHQRWDEDPTLNKGIGQLRVEVDLAVARSGQVQGPTLDLPLDPWVEAAPLEEGSSVTVTASKAMTGLWVTIVAQVAAGDA
ncbi:MAG TPA: hypothetical protein VHP33_20510 [Polyangiaceae bacterium]|nr:hypothetical protein [Polyangiaceae bacterium]